MRFFPGQASTELISVLGILLIVVLAFVVLSTNFVNDLNAQKNYNAGRDTVQKLAQAADSVYSQGEGASMSVPVIIPPTAVMESNKSFIGKPSNAPAGSDANTINLRVGGSDIYSFTVAPLSGAFPASPGNYKMRVTSHGNYVSVGSGLIDINVSSIFLAARSDGKARAEFGITTGSPDSTTKPVYVQISYSPEHTNVGLAISPTNFITSGGTAVSLEFTPASSAAGIYNWLIRINASECGSAGRAGCPSDFFELPVTLEINND